MKLINKFYFKKFNTLSSTLPTSLLLQPLEIHESLTERWGFFGPWVRSKGVTRGLVTGGAGPKKIQFLALYFSIFEDQFLGE